MRPCFSFQTIEFTGVASYLTFTISKYYFNFYAMKETLLKNNAFQTFGDINKKVHKIFIIKLTTL